MKPTVFIVLAQFSHYSDVLRTGCIELLAKRFRVIVLTPAIDEVVAERDGYPRGDGEGQERRLGRAQKDGKARLRQGAG